MSETVIKAENLSKLYRLGEIHKQTNSIRDRISQKFKSFIHKRQRSAISGQSSESSSVHSATSTIPSSQDNSIWALKDVSFSVKKGEIVGIIGGNGAGKSTLLKILSRITRPTEGKVFIEGRVGSLLEVGTGFHPELTGRENVYLNGTILGMRKSEIRKKFNEIINFAEVEKFIDTPVKRYSSGMYVRLAFSVTAHLDQEILLVDEVLSVGDFGFQKKCIDKLKKMGNKNRTILFVSHNMTALANLCDRVILLDGGEILEDGPSQDVIHTYLQSGTNTIAEKKWIGIENAPGNEIVRMLAMRVRNEDGRTVEKIDIQNSVGIEIQYEVLKSDHKLVPSCLFYNEEGVKLFHTLDTELKWRSTSRPKGHYISTVWMPGNFFSEGRIYVDTGLATLNPEKVHCHINNALAFQIFDSFHDNPTRGDFVGPLIGVVRPLLKWNTQFNSG